MTQPAPGPATKGPIGQTRDAGREALLSLITCGIYAYYWIYVAGEDLKQYNREGLGGVVLLLLTLVLLAAEIERTYQEDGRESPCSPLAGLWLLIPLAGIYIYVQKLQTALNDYWASKGAAPAA